jgi:hypothetical protein
MSALAPELKVQRVQKAIKVSQIRMLARKKCDCVSAVDRGREPDWKVHPASRLGDILSGHCSGAHVSFWRQNFFAIVGWDGFSDTLEDAALRAFDQDTSRHRRLSCPPFDSFQP